MADDFAQPVAEAVTDWLSTLEALAADQAPHLLENARRLSYQTHFPRKKRFIEAMQFTISAFQ